MVTLLDAVEEGDEGEVIRLLDAHPELLDAMPSQLDTSPELLIGVALLHTVIGLNQAVVNQFLRERVPLVLASVHGHLRIVTLLLQRGANPGAVGCLGTTALQWAARKGHEEVVVCLLNKGAQPNSKDIRDRTPLIEAARGGYVGIVQVLVQHLDGQGLDEADDHGLTALHHATERGHEEVVAALLGHGVHADVRGRDGTLPLMLGCATGKLSVVQMLLQHTAGQGLDAADDQGRTALHHAADGGHEVVVGFLLSKGAQPNSAEAGGRTPLMWASRRGHLGAVQLLLQHVRGQALAVRDDIGATALHYAAVEGHERVVDALLNGGADRQSKDHRGMGPFILAALKGHLGVVRVLLQHMGGQGLDEVGSYGLTALHIAAVNAHEEVLKCLLLAGADPTRRNDAGDTPRAIAEEEGHEDCVAVFDWWEGELERRAILSRATCLHNVNVIQRDKPTSPMPIYLEARAAAGHALPIFEVVLPPSQQQQGEEQQAGVLGKRKAADGQGDAGEIGMVQDEKHAMLEYVVKELNEELVTELLEGFHS